MSHCNHDWLYGEAATDSAELLVRITDAGDNGLWIKDNEMDMATQLVSDGLITMCGTCDRSATLTS